MTVCDRLLKNACILDASGLQKDNQSIAIKNGMIVWCGQDEALPMEYLMEATYLEDCHGNLVTPGLIDCHTHLVYAGNRASEFKLKLQGMSYADIAKAGGGILSTVRQTREASLEDLFMQSLPRILALKKEGVTTVEIKSGYGLDIPNELKMLRVARMLGEETGVNVRTTFLGAHATAPEYQGNKQAYIDDLCNEMLPQIAESGLVDAVDVFCESIGFSLAQTEQVFAKAQDLGLPVKCHAEQLSLMGASSLAASFHALSCDHLEYLDKAGVDALAKAATVAVLLPGAYYFLKASQKPPIALFREAGVKVAIATDCNPGSSPNASLLLMMNMACQLFGMRVDEVLTAVTYNAARALGLENERGVIAVGMAADLVRWPVQESALLCYYFAPCVQGEVMIAGEWVV